MLKVGLTGGIGAGKSEVSRLLARRGAVSAWNARVGRTRRVNGDIHDTPETIRPPAATPRALPTAAWINPPNSLVAEVDAHKTSATRCSKLIHML